MSGGEAHDDPVRRFTPSITIFAFRSWPGGKVLDRPSSHKITVCISCRHKSGRHKHGSDDPACRPGFELIERLRSALELAENAIGAEFEISGTACMAGCERPCTVAYFGSHKATYLFGNIDADENIDDLVAFARQYAALPDGWCSSSTRPKGLSGKTLARVPAAVLVNERGGVTQ